MNNPSFGIKPEDLSDSEVLLWKAYYQKDPREIAKALLKFIQYHYNVENPAELVPAYMHTLVTFAHVPQEALQETYEKDILPLLEALFVSLQEISPLTFDPHPVARAELQWWIARRGTPLEYDPQNIGSLMQASYVLLYGGKREEYETTAFLRARAARRRDEYWEISEGKGLTDHEWQEVRELLFKAYSHFPFQRIFAKT